MENQSPASTPSVASTSTESTSNAESSNSQSNTSQTAASVNTPQSQTTPKPSPQPPQRIKLVVDGNEEEVELSELQRRAQLGSAAQKRFEEAARLRDNIAKFVETVKKNPIEALMDKSLGLSKEQLRSAMEQWYKREFIDPEMLTPEQRRIQELEAKAKEYEFEKAKENEAREQQAREAETQQEIKNYEEKIVAALQAKDFVKDSTTIAAMARYLELSAKNKLNLSPEQLADVVYRDQQVHTKNIISKMEGEQLIKFLGEDLINKVRKADLARLKSSKTTPSTPKPTAPAADNYQLQQGEPIDMSSVRNYFENLK